MKTGMSSILNELIFCVRQPFIGYFSFSVNMVQWLIAIMLMMVFFS